MEQSLNAPSAKGCNETTVSPCQLTSQARPTSGSICRLSGASLSGSLIASCDSGNSPRKLSYPGAYQGKMPFGATPSEATLTKSAASPACSRCPAKLPATPNPNHVRSSASSNSSMDGSLIIMIHSQVRSWFQHRPSDVGHQRFGHADAAVRLLVVLQDGDQPAGSRERAVERRRGLRLAVLVAVT